MVFVEPDTDRGQRIAAEYVASIIRVTLPGRPDGERIGGPETVLEPVARFLVAVEGAIPDEVMNRLRG